MYVFAFQLNTKYKNPAFFLKNSNQVQINKLLIVFLLPNY